MDTIVNEKKISFKELEEKIFRYICELGCEITRIMLEAYDDELCAGRDRKKYRDKGRRKTSIKTVYGTVEYSRRVYMAALGSGETAYVYLLDGAMQMDKIGQISTNLAEKIATMAAESPYRVTAAAISSACGQGISAGGVWEVVQRLGERISGDEDRAVEQMEAGRTEGTRGVPVLFEEMDGIWLHMQDRRHRKMKKQEMKACTMYEGWDAEKEAQGRSSLVGKRALAGMEGSGEFHKKREACIRKRYDADGIGQRILNGDGGPWVKEPYDPDAIFQLDPYHVYQEIQRKISGREAQEEIRRLYDEGKPDEMLECIKAYAAGMESPDGKGGSSKALELYRYLERNREGLLPYGRRGIRIPEPEAGVVYKGMGVQENQNCTVITLRMKNRRMRWSVGGANNMAKVLYTRENGELPETVARHTDGTVMELRMQEVMEPLSAARAPKRDGKGDPYADVINAHMPIRDAMQTAARKAFVRMFS